MIPESDLRELVLGKIAVLGESAAAAHFDVSVATIRSWKAGRTNPSLEAAQRCFSETLALHSPETWDASPQREKVCLLLPMYENVEPLHLFTLIRCLKLYGMHNVTVIPVIRTLIDEARNDLAEKFLLTGIEYGVFMDADMILPCGSAQMLANHGLRLPEPKGSRNAIERIMSHSPEHRIVGALYKDRRGKGKVQCEKGFSSAEENNRLMALFRDPHGSDGLEEVGWTGFGMVRIHRSVFLEMKAAAENGGALQDIHPPPPPREKEPYGFFGRTNKWRGEDVAFCRRAGMIGIKTYIDTGLLLGHRGGFIY